MRGARGNELSLAQGDRWRRNLDQVVPLAEVGTLSARLIEPVPFDPWNLDSPHHDEIEDWFGDHPPVRPTRRSLVTEWSDLADVLEAVPETFCDRPERWPEYVELPSTARPSPNRPVVQRCRRCGTACPTCSPGRV